MIVEFNHKAPKGYSYEFEEFKRNVVSIWIRNHSKFDYNLGASVRSIWGFYNTKKQCYIYPITHKRPGKPIDVNVTTAYTAMPLLKSYVEQ